MNTTNENLGTEKYRSPEIENLIASEPNNGEGRFVYYVDSDMLWLSAPMAQRLSLHQYEGNYLPLMVKQLADIDSAEQAQKVFHRIRAGAKHAECVVRMLNDMNRYFISLNIVDDYDGTDGKSRVAIGTARKLLDGRGASKSQDGKNEALAISTTIASGISTMFYAMYYIWVDDGTYICCQEQLESILDDIGHKGLFVPAWKCYIEKYIELADQEKVRSFANLDTLPDRLADTNSISCVYRRIGIGWTRGTFVAASRHSTGRVRNILYVVSDINKEIITEQQRQKAEYEAGHDALTGVRNRSAFDGFRASPEFANANFGLMMIDIDHFRDINNTFGHRYGDDILRRVAALLVSEFRKNDIVFRIGGDEFIVYLSEATPQIWNAVCQKIHDMHMRLREETDQRALISFSCGLCFSSGENTQDMMTKCEHALYRTKCSGRAGCTMYDIATGVSACWIDAEIDRQRVHLVSQQELGSWCLELPKSGQRLLHCDGIMYEKLAMPQEFTPEAASKYFVSRLHGISSRSFENMLVEMSKGRVAEVSLQWEHPYKGNIFLRFGGQREVQDRTPGIPSFAGYLHVLENVYIMSDYDDVQGIRAALEEQYCCNYFLNLEDMTYAVCKEQSSIRISESTGAVPNLFARLVEFITARESQEAVRNFLQLDRLASSLKTENSVELEFKTNDMDWCKFHVLVVSRDSAGEAVSLCLLIESVAQSHAQRVREERERMKRSLIIEKMVPMLSRGLLLAIGYSDSKGNIHFLENNLGWNTSKVCSIDSFIEHEANNVDEDIRAKFLQKLNLENVKNTVEKTGKLSCDFVMNRQGTRSLVAFHICRLNSDDRSYLFLMEDVSEPASIDSVSGVLNRGGFEIGANRLFAQDDVAQEYSLIDFNISNFRVVNTVYGFSSGDSVLREAAVHLKNSALKPLLLCRNKDDRFFCIVRKELVTEDNIEKARKFQVKLRDGFHNMEFICGICHVTDKLQPVSRYMDCAMMAVRSAKNAVLPKSVCEFTESMDRSYRDQAYVLDNLDTALLEEQFVVFYQPIFDAISGLPVSAEALVRWKNPERGMVPPYVFVPALEQNGLMYRVDGYVQQKVMAFIKKRLASEQHVVPVAVNLSRADLFNSGFLDDTESLLDNCGFTPELMRFEVTESCLTDIPQNAQLFLDRVRTRGCKVLVDDFGTGASALKTIAERDYDVLKIDKSFVDRIGNSSKVESVISAVIGMGHGLSLKITAEGVETQSQFDFLKQAGCDYIQGYLFSKPLPEDEFSLLLDKFTS